MANLGYVQVTRECNQRCRFCSNPPIERKQTLERVKAQMDDLASRHYHGVILTGGEPTLSPFLSKAIRYARTKGIGVRIITNGQLIADPAYLKELVSSGLDHVHVSIHSARPEVQAQLSDNPDSFANIERSLQNLADGGLTADINTVICAQNADHLEQTVDWVLDRFPFIHHFVFNNLDPSMNRCADNPDVIPALADFELGLYRAMRRIDSAGRTFRVERVPLCYMADYAHCSTETRKIVKGEERFVHFLDEQKGAVRQTVWTHHKADCCQVCRLDPICAGLYGAPTYFDPAELHPLFIDPEPIKRRILNPANPPPPA
jgi:MoaA/NifB/PqqE/SkfB family radical SAM enzyme